AKTFCCAATRCFAIPSAGRIFPKVNLFNSNNHCKNCAVCKKITLCCADTVKYPHWTVKRKTIPICMTLHTDVNFPTEIQDVAKLFFDEVTLGDDGEISLTQNREGGV